MKKFKSLSKEEERIGKAVVESAFSVHKAFGPGLLEKFMKSVLFMSCVTDIYLLKGR